jgi:hypothetical protein
MFMGYFLIISGYFLYWLLKPQVPHKPIIQEEFVYFKNPSIEGEGLTGCLSSQQSIH